MQNKGGKTIFLAALAALSFFRLLTLRLVCVHLFPIILILGHTGSTGVHDNKDYFIVLEPRKMKTSKVKTKIKRTKTKTKTKTTKKRSNVLN